MDMYDAELDLLPGAEEMVTSGVTHSSENRMCVLYQTKFKKSIFSPYKFWFRKKRLTLYQSGKTPNCDCLKKKSKGWCNFHLVMSTVNVNVHQCFLHVALALALVCFL